MNNSEQKPAKQVRKQVKRKLPEAMKKTQFKKGQSGNPNGRPKKGSAIADILGNIGDELVEVNGERITKREAVLRKVYAEAVKGQNWAVQFIADRTEGKAIDRIIQQEVKDEIVIE